MALHGINTALDGRVEYEDLGRVTYCDINCTARGPPLSTTDLEPQWTTALGDETCTFCIDRVLVSASGVHTHFTVLRQLWSEKYIE